MLVRPFKDQIFEILLRNIHGVIRALNNELFSNEPLANM
ncbi:unnamed protein product [Acidithrix sp. C25]|nr:unnamed protein product [Acidithrix sp. C25]